MVAPTIVSYWRDSARLPRFFGIDARSAFPLLFFLVHIRLWTFIAAVTATVLFALIERYGMSTIVFMRSMRSILAGRRKVVRPWWREDKPL